MNEIYRLKPKDQSLNNINRNNNNYPKYQNTSKYYLTENLDKSINQKEKESVLKSSIYQTIKTENKKAYTSNHSKTNSRNNFIKTINEINDNSNKTSYMTPKICIRKKIIYQDKEDVKQNKEIKKLKNSYSNADYLHNLNNNRVIFSTYNGIFDEIKLNKNNLFTCSNNITKLNSINKENTLEKNRKNNIIDKIKNIIDKKIKTDAKQKSNNNSRIKLKINNNDNFEQKIKDNNIRKNRGIINNYKNSNYNSINNSMNKSLNVTDYKKHKKLIKSELKKSILFSNKGINILNKIIKNRKYNIWKEFKYKIMNAKYFNNNIFNVQSISYNNFQIKNNFIKENINKHENILKNCINQEKNIFNLKRSQLLYSPNRTNKNENIKQNKLKDNSDNQILKSKLKNIYLKYLVEKKNYINNIRHQKSLYIINKNNIIINNKENRRKYLLKKIISKVIQTKNYILKKSFIKFYFRCKLLNQQRKFFCFKDFQDEFILMQKLYQIFYQKEKNNILFMKNYFDKFRSNTLLKNHYSSTNFHYDKNYLTKRNRKLKLIIANITNHNNIIIKNILKQWLLRSKIIKLTQNTRINNECKNIIQKEDLIKGINKLNDIFKAYQTINSAKDMNEENNTNKDVERDEQKSLNIINENQKKDLFENDNSIQNLYSDKYKIDSIIEEKEEEEQTEE